MALTAQTIEYNDTLVALRNGSISILTNYLRSIELLVKYTNKSGSDSYRVATRADMCNQNTDILPAQTMSELTRSRAKTALTAVRRLNGLEVAPTNLDEAATILNEFKSIITAAINANDVHSTSAGKNHQTSTTQRNSHWYQRKSESVANYDHIIELIGYAEQRLSINPANTDELDSNQQHIADRKNTCSLL